MRSKKAMELGILVSIIATIISFFVIFSYLATTSSFIVNEKSDLGCRALLSIKDNSIYKTVSEFTTLINRRCGVDKINDINAQKPDEVFKAVGDEMSRCYSRYGEGQFDFLGNFDTDGNWCFLCGELEFQNKGPVYPYAGTKGDDFITWTQNNINKNSEDKKTYFDSLELKYSNIEANEYGELGVQLDLLFEEAEGATKELLFYLGDQYEYLGDLQKKEINTNEKLFVVYRYDRPPRDIGEITEDILIATGVGIGAGMVIESAVLLSLAPFTFGATAVIAAAKGAYKAAKTTKQIKLISKIEELISRFSNMIKFSRTSTVIGKVKNIHTVKHIEDLASNVKHVNPKLANNLFETTKMMNKIGIDNIDDIGKVALKSEKNKELLLNRIKTATQNSLLTDSGYLRAAAKNSKLTKQVNDLRKLESEIKTSLDAAEKLDISLVTKIQNYFKNLLATTAVVAAGSGAGGGTIGALTNFDNFQYVDVLTQEQYYRLCGTQRIQD